jgi:hypothetical protein
MAAFTAAYEAYAQDVKRAGLGKLDPVKLVETTTAVSCKRTPDGIEVHFYSGPAPVRGGGITYLVDSKSMRILRREYGS